MAATKSRALSYALTNAAVTEALRAPNPRRIGVSIFNSHATATVLVGVTDGSHQPSVAELSAGGYQVALVAPGAVARVDVSARNRVFLLAGAATGACTITEEISGGSFESNLLPVGVPELSPIDGSNQVIHAAGVTGNTLLAGNGGSRRKVVAKNHKGSVWLSWTGYYNVTGTANGETPMANEFRIYSAGIIVFDTAGAEVGRYMASVPVDNAGAAPWMTVSPGDIRFVEIPNVPLQEGQQFEVIWHWRVSATGQITYAYGDCDPATEFSETYTTAPVDKVTNVAALPAYGNGYHWFAPSVFTETTQPAVAMISDSLPDQPKYMPGGRPFEWGMINQAAKESGLPFLNCAASSWRVGTGAENGCEQMGMRLRFAVSTCQTLLLMGGANDLLNPPSGGSTQVFNVWKAGVMALESYVSQFGLRVVLVTPGPAGVASTNLYTTQAGQTAFTNAYWKQMITFIRQRREGDRIDILPIIMVPAENKYLDAEIFLAGTVNAAGGNANTATRTFFDPGGTKYGDLHNFVVAIGGVFKVITASGNANGQSFFDTSTWGAAQVNGTAFTIYASNSVDGTHLGAIADQNVGIEIGRQVREKL